MKVNRILQLAFLFILLFSLSNCKKNKPDILYDRKYIDEIKAARKDAVFFLSRNFIPGGTFAVAKDGKIIYSEGMGQSSKDLETPATRQTKFRIGQVSELLTSAIYHKMVEQKMLHPDSTVQHYYPEFPEKQFKLSIHHLVNQTSGIREPNMDETDWRGLNVTIQAGIDNIREDSLIAPPGIYQIPSYYNYNLLGAVMEKAAGENFSKILAGFLTDTLNLTNTVIDNPFITIKGRSNFYDHNFISQLVNATTRDMRFRAPSEGMLSNAEDLVKFGNAVLFSDYFQEMQKSSFFEPIPLFNNIPSNMVNGWILMTDRDGRKIYGKSGKVTGGAAAILVYPEEKLVVACATNLGAISDDYPVFDIASHFLNKSQPKPAPPNEDEVQD
ncbi:MAG TPA: class A beta-lactamase-related serine hydrolase [Mariniphaga anaerophila]|uniref:Class A beta-lactamase-related serine hydrolase n=1 Tax=Mariniphaga anaerophila TaxID=1484053 RepID=A0A831LN96_9BACT|nr:class A beta-lactamase-related serine hydrolase [Mariniphaga anaerophila]